MESNSQPFDLSLLVKQSNNDREFIRSMLELFVSRMAEMVKNLEIACNKNNLKIAYSLSHKMIPSVEMIGSKRLSALLKQVNLQANQGETINQDVVKKIIFESEQVINALALWLEQEDSL